MAIYITCDHAGFELKNIILDQFKTNNLIDLSPDLIEGDDYPLVAKNLVKYIKDGDFGIAICGSGQGICIALNRFKGIRAALVYDEKTAVVVRKHNHANILCLAGKNQTISIQSICNIVNIFLDTEPDQDIRHLRRIKELDEVC